MTTQPTIRDVIRDSVRATMLSDRGAVAPVIPSIQDQIPEAEFQLLATNYSGSGDFLNEIESPFTGASQSEYDFQLVNSPTHSTDHFLLDGTNYFKVAANSTWIADLHKDNGVIDCTFCFITDFTNLSPNVSIMGNTDSPTGSGFHLQGRTDGFNDTSTRFLQDGLVNITEFTTLDTLVGGTQFAAYTVSGANQEAVGYIDATNEVDTFTSTSTTTTEASAVLHLGCTNNGTIADEIMVNGSKIYGVIAVAKACTPAEVATIQEFMNEQLGTSTPVPIYGSASINGSATVTAAATKSNQGDATINGSATVTASATRSTVGDASISGSATVTANATVSGDTPALPASTVFDLDATVLDSYGGSGQTWANIEATPADSESQTAYDFYLGAGSGSSTDDPTFNGTAGDSAAYWSFDNAGKHFSLAGALTSFLQDLHKTTGGEDEAWIAFAGQSFSGAGSEFIFNTTDGSSPRYGIGWRLNGTASGSFNFFNNTSSGNNATSTGLTAGTDFVIVVSFSKSGNNFRCWVNSTTAVDDTTLTTTASTTNCEDMEIGKFGSGTLPSDFRLYAVSVGNTLLNDTSVADIFTTYNTRHDRTYNP